MLHQQKADLSALSNLLAAGICKTSIDNETMHYEDYVITTEL